MLEEGVVRDWRAAYTAFGFKPSLYRSSIEALLRRILNHKHLPSIRPVVDLYNYISVKHALAMGGDDIDRINEKIELTVAKGGEPFTMLGKAPSEPIREGEVIYRDVEEVLCRAWNYRECEKSKITEQTRNACLVIEGLQSASKESVVLAAEELAGLIQRYCGGEAKVEYFSAPNSAVQ